MQLAGKRRDREQEQGREGAQDNCERLMVVVLRKSYAWKGKKRFLGDEVWRVSAGCVVGA